MMTMNMNHAEMNENELEMVNGGSETVVIDLSKHRDCPSIGPVPTRNRYKSLREIQLEERLADMKRAELNDNEQEMVNGGFFTRNSLSEERYHECGIRTEYHTFSADEFWLPDGTKTDMAGANEYIKKTVGNETYMKWWNEHSIIPRHHHS